MKGENLNDKIVDEKWMRYALNLAKKAAEQGEVPVGAVVVNGGEIIGEGWNRPIISCDPTAHAEVVALRDAGLNEQNYRLPGTTLYVTIEPCTMCAGAIIHSRVTRVVYGATEPKSGVIESNPCVFDGEHLNHKVEFSGGVLASECSDIVSSFFKARREVKKKNL
ncbi:MAG: tRNA(Arg) A34 adenosine deaminase TadA [Pseudohongiellaceae bacterium]